MMRERDIRQETFEEYKDSKPSKLVTFSALTTGVGMLAAFGFGQFSFFFGSAIGLVFIIVICRYIYVFRKKCKKRRDLIMRGYRTEAEVVELKQETDLDGDLITVAVYRFTLSGGEEHRFKRPVNSSVVGLMGAIQVGAKFDICSIFIWRILMSRNTRCKSLNRCLAFKTRIATSSTNTSKS